jgi:hypothetical protein
MLHDHDWGWPRRDSATGKDIQTCTRCGSQRESVIQFERRPEPGSLRFSTAQEHTPGDDVEGGSKRIWRNADVATAAGPRAHLLALQPDERQ